MLMSRHYLRHLHHHFRMAETLTKESTHQIKQETMTMKANKRDGGGERINLLDGKPICLNWATCVLSSVV